MMMKKKRLLSAFIVFIMLTNSLVGLLANPVSAAEIIPDGKTATNLETNNNIIDITTGTIEGVNAFNSFEIFNVGQADVVNLHLPDATTNLINLVHNQRSEINGILNSIKDQKIGGNVFFLNPHGTLVGET